MPGTLSLLVSVVCSQGRRPYMEDTYSVKDLADGQRVFAVFDGHGGKEVAEMCAERFAETLQSELKKNYDVSVGLRNTFHKLDQQAQPLCHACGCTAVVGFLEHQRLWFANCGDAMAMVSWKHTGPTFVTQDHKVENEALRVRALGGQVTYDDGCARINRMLNIARSIGDYHLKPIVIANPYVTSVQLFNVDYVVIASDGLWDVYHPDMVEEDVEKWTLEYKEKGITNRREVVDLITRRLVETAYAKGSTDNIALIFVDVQY